MSPSFARQNNFDPPEYSNDKMNNNNATTTNIFTGAAMPSSSQGQPNGDLRKRFQIKPLKLES